jgi:hypothetical protein
MITPNGRFKPGKQICTTFTSLHPEEWNPAWTVEAILTGFLSFMTGKEKGGGCIEEKDDKRRELAAQSKRWNSTECENFRGDFPEAHDMNGVDCGFTEEEKKVYGMVERVAAPETETLTDTGSSSNMNEDWEKYGSMEDDFDFYDDEDDFDYDEGQYNTPDTEVDGVEKEMTA